MRTPEGKVKDEIRAFLKPKSPEVWYFMPMMMGYGRRGIPDFVGCAYGYMFSIETKSRVGGLTPWQLREGEAIRQSGGKTYVISSTYTLDMFEYDFDMWLTRIANDL